MAELAASQACELRSRWQRLAVVAVVDVVRRNGDQISMDDLLDDMTRAAQRCDRAVRTLKEDPYDAIRERVQQQVKVAHRAWSGSWIGYHARVYIESFDAPHPDERFDAEWGFQQAMSNGPHGRWALVDDEGAKAELLRRARVSAADLKLMDETALRARTVFDETKGELLPTLDVALSLKEDPVLRRVRDEIDKTPAFTSEHDIAAMSAPKRAISRDSSAMMEGWKVAPHLQLEHKVLFQLSCGFQLVELAKHARYVATYLQKGMKMTGKSVARTDGKIFLGHGGSKVWRDLKDFVQDRLKLPWDEFNREPTAGMSTKERLQSMLDEAVFAFLVMTAEDERADGTKQARMNVIHEIGLFQGRLGFERAIVLLEEGCEEFSNIQGITQIRFPAGKISAQFEEIRRVLEREKILR